MLGRITFWATWRSLGISKSRGNAPYFLNFRESSMSLRNNLKLVDPVWIVLHPHKNPWRIFGDLTWGSGMAAWWFWIYIADQNRSLIYRDMNQKVPSWVLTVGPLALDRSFHRFKQTRWPLHINNFTELFKIGTQIALGKANDNVSRVTKN